MRKVLTFLLPLLLIAGAGLFFGYPPYVESRILADIDKHNQENPDQRVIITGLSANPWSSTLTAQEVSIKNGMESAVASDLSVTTDSFLFLTPVRTLVSVSTGEFHGADTSANTSFRFAGSAATGVSSGLLNFSASASNAVPFTELLKQSSFESFTFSDGSFEDGNGQKFTVARMILSDFHDAKIGELLMEDVKPKDGDSENVSFANLIIRDVDLTDLEGFANAGALWSPVSSGASDSKVFEIGYLEIAGAHAAPNDDRTEKVTLDRFILTGLTYDAPDTASDPEPIDVIEVLTFQSAVFEGMNVDGAEDVDVRAGRFAVTGFDKGSIGSIELSDFDVVSPQGKVKVGSFVTDGINLADILRAAEKGNQGEKAITPLLRAWNFGGFDMKDGYFEGKDGDTSSVAAISLRGLDYYEGLPVAATLTVTDSYQSISKAKIEEELEKLIGPVVLDFPTETLSSGDAVYRMDMATGVLTVTSKSLDSKHGMRSLFDLRLSGLSPVFTAAAGNDPGLQNHLPGIALEKAVIEIDSGEDWPVPEPVGGVPTVRMFLMQLLGQVGAGAQGPQNIVLTPAHSFLERGGLFRLALEPPQAFPVLQMQILPMLPPEQAIGLIGLTAVHE